MPTVKELKDRCRERNLTGYSTLRKAELEELLRSDGYSPVSSGSPVGSSSPSSTDTYPFIDLNTISTKKELVQWLKDHNIKFPNLKKDDLFSFVDAVQRSKADPIRYIEYGSGDNRMPDIQFVHPTITSLDNLRTTLYNNGYAVVKVLDEGEALEKRDHLMNLAARVAPEFDPHDPTTWKTTKMPLRTHGILKGKISNTPEMWDLRLHPNIRRVFETIWNTNDLLASLDTFNCSPSQRNPPKEAWLHSDMPNIKLYDGYPTFQMVLNLTPVSESSPPQSSSPSGSRNPGTLLVVPPGDFRDYYYHITSRAPYLGYGWGGLSTSNYGAVNFVLPIVPMGHALIWDSRIFHMGYPGVSSEDDELKLRIAAYFSYFPRSLATPADITKRQKIYGNGNGTDHWCVGPFLRSSSPGRNYGRTNLVDYSELQLFEPTPDQQELVDQLIGI